MESKIYKLKECYPDNANKKSAFLTNGGYSISPCDLHNRVIHWATTNLIDRSLAYFAVNDVEVEVEETSFFPVASISFSFPILSPLTILFSSSSLISIVCRVRREQSDCRPGPINSGSLEQHYKDWGNRRRGKR